jgi:hypothetical protein
MRTTLIGIVGACLVAFTVLFQRPASALTLVAATPPAGLSVEAKDAPGNNGFDFKFKSGSSSATVSIDPLGNRHNDSATISSSGGAITLNGKYDRNNRKIEITARRAGTEVGSYSWRVEAVLR